MLDKRQFYIDGRWVAPRKANDFDVIDPSTEAIAGVISLGDRADTDAAVAAANSAFDGWSASSRDERVALLERILELYKARYDDIAQAISLEMGAPIDLARSQQAGSGLSHIKSFIRTLKAFEFERILGPHAPNDRIFYEPVGVCGLITPWNWPMNQVALKVIPALAGRLHHGPQAFGNRAVVVNAVRRESCMTPERAGRRVQPGKRGWTKASARCCLKHAPGPRHDLVYRIDARLGSTISKNAADTLKRVHLELGGKGANIIFSGRRQQGSREKRRTLHCFNNTGQSCNAPTRMLVPRDRSTYECVAVKVAAEVASATKWARHHLGRKAGIAGPAVSRSGSSRRSRAYIQSGIDEGATPGCRRSRIGRKACELGAGTCGRPCLRMCQMT